jgi:hypothetical protein
MRAQRIKIRFHRIGLVVAVICGVPVALMLAAAPIAYGGFLFGLLSKEAGDGRLALALIAVIALVCAIGCYAIAWALGWIVAGIVGDGDQNPN